MTARDRELFASMLALQRALAEDFHVLAEHTKTITEQMQNIADLLSVRRTGNDNAPIH